MASVSTGPPSSPRPHPAPVLSRPQRERCQVTGILFRLLFFKVHYYCSESAGEYISRRNVSREYIPSMRIYALGLARKRGKQLAARSPEGPNAEGVPAGSFLS